MDVQFKVKNFRCFDDFNIDSFKRVNLIAGKNNVGKTALLEALWLHHGSPIPDLGIRLNNFRDIKLIRIDEPLAELFRNLDSSSSILLKSRDDSNHECSTKLFIREATSLPIPSDNEPLLGKQSVFSKEFVGKELVVKFTDANGVGHTSRATFSGDDIRFTRSTFKRSKAKFLQSRRSVGAEDVEIFGDIEIHNRKKELLSWLTSFEPRLRDLTVVMRGGGSSIWGDIGIGTLIPLQLMGEGLCRLLSNVQSLMTCEQGIVLIDEIENGIHYSIMTDVWKMLARLAEQYDVQIFATTHSSECIRYAHQAFMSSEKYDFSLFRLELVNNRVKAITYDKGMLDTAIETGLEYR